MPKPRLHCDMTAEELEASRKYKREHARAWYAKNKEAVCAKQRARYKEDQEYRTKSLTRMRGYKSTKVYTPDEEKRRKKRKQLYAQRWRKENPNKWKQYSATYRAKQRLKKKADEAVPIAPPVPLDELYDVLEM